MRVAALARDGVDRLHVVGAVLVEELVHVGDDVVLAHARLELLVNEVIGAVHHGGGAVEQRDLVGAFDLTRLQHDLLAVVHLQARLLQLEQHRRLDDVDADRHVGDAGLADQRSDLLGVALHQPERRIDGTAQPDQAGLAVLRRKPGRVELVVHGRRAEIPQDRLAAAREQRPARELIALPFADLGRGDVADVVDVEHEQRAELGFLECHPRPRKAVTMEAAVIDALLEIHSHDAERWKRATPVEAGVDVLGRDLADGLFHGPLLSVLIRRNAPLPHYISQVSSGEAKPIKLRWFSAVCIMRSRCGEKTP